MGYVESIYPDVDDLPAWDTTLRGKLKLGTYAKKLDARHDLLLTPRYAFAVIGSTPGVVASAQELARQHCFVTVLGIDPAKLATHRPLIRLSNSCGLWMTL